jgi:hypothetical protein
MQKISSFYLNFLIVILVIISAFVLFHVYSQFQENKSTESWEKTFGPMEDLPNQYPYRNDNEAAVQLKLLAVRLGIDFNVEDEGRHFTPLAVDAKRLKSFDRDYLVWRNARKQVETKDDSVDPLPPLITNYLFDYKKQLEDVRDFILTSSPILWRQNLNSSRLGYQAAAAPNVSAIWYLQLIMSTRALELTAARNYQEAEKYLEAQLKLNESLKSRCDLVSQQYALGTDIGIMNLMRKLPLSENWISKLVEHNYEKAYIKGFMIEAWYFWRQRNEYQMSKSSILNGIFDPYLRLGVSSKLEKEINELQQLQKTDPCDIGFKQLREYQSSTWNRIPFRWELYFKLDTYTEITELKLLRELTTRVIKVKHGYFPKDGSDRSEACKDGTWEYWRSQDRATTIKYNGRIEHTHTLRDKFPTPFTVKNR